MGATTYVRLIQDCMRHRRQCVYEPGLTSALNGQEPLFLTQNVNDEVGRPFRIKDDGLVVRSMKKGAATAYITIVSVGDAAP